MNIPSHELQAFRTTAQVLSFSAAAERIHITQSALSQRIQSLERRLGVTLFVRDRKATKLTEAGIRLLRYCQAKDHLESELIGDLIEAPAGGKLGGHLRIAAFSSVLHSVIMPALAPLLRDNPSIQFEFSMREMKDLPDVLMRGEADFVIMSRHYKKNNILAHNIGQERYVLIQSKTNPANNIYLDHDPEDKFTKLFFKTQGKEHLDINRSYVDDIDGIIKGVALGLGLGIVPCHLLRNDLPVRVVKSFKTMNSPVILHYFRQPYYSKLQEIVIGILRKDCGIYLK